ncbi:MAG: lipopolysaccharide heptosyltransferase I [Gammaproteobacteria bacterium]|nr:lipopolysaccharide heptosyltransferase I [Gammaproteobacteria bacterium]
MRVLIVKVSSLGDIIHTLPAVTDAHRARRNLVFDWVVEENFVEVPAWHPAVDRVIPVALRRWRKDLLGTWRGGEFQRFRKTLQSVDYDLVIDAQGLIKSGVISRLAQGLTIGLNNLTVREPLATMFYNKVYSVPWTDHAVDRVRQLFARALQHRYNKSEVDYGLDKAQFQDKSRPEVGRSVLFLHGTTWATKHWPQNYWRQLARLATDSDYEVLIPWGDEGEKQRAQLIAADNPGVRVLDRLSLSGLAEEINASTGVIGVDTGLGHLATALSKPTLSLYGPTDPDRSGTFGENQLHMSSTLTCAPCLKRRCSYTGPDISDKFDGRVFAVSPACYSTHQPRMVWQQFQQLVSG